MLRNPFCLAATVIGVMSAFGCSAARSASDTASSITPPGPQCIQTIVDAETAGAIGSTAAVLFHALQAPAKAGAANVTASESQVTLTGRHDGAGLASLSCTKNADAYACRISGATRSICGQDSQLDVRGHQEIYADSFAKTLTEALEASAETLHQVYPTVPVGGLSSGGGEPESSHYFKDASGSLVACYRNVVPVLKGDCAHGHGSGSHGVCQKKVAALSPSGACSFSNFQIAP